MPLMRPNWRLRGPEHAAYHVERTIPRVLGIAALVAPVWLLGTTTERWWFWALVSVAWVGVGLALIAGRLSVLTAAVAALLALLPWVAPREYAPVDAMLFWLGVIVATTAGRPWERALLLRIFLTTFYGFAALSKLNPAWLNADQLFYLVDEHTPFLAALTPIIDSPAGPMLAALVLLAEGWLAVGLWWSRTRTFTVVWGIVVHVGLVVSASAGPLYVLVLGVLNFLPIALYVAFWCPVHPPRGASAVDRSRFEGAA